MEFVASHVHLDGECPVEVLVPRQRNAVRVDLTRGGCYDWVSSEEGKTSETGRSAELAFVQRDWS